VIRTLASTENPLFIQASMSAAAAAASRLYAEPPHDAAPHPLGERGQIARGNRPGWQERRQCVTPCMVGSRHEDTVGDAGVQVHVVGERRDGSGAVGKHAPKSLRHGDHPLPHGHRRHDVIDEVRGGLRHVPAIGSRAAQRAESA